MLKCASFFAGVGGIDMGFEQADLKQFMLMSLMSMLPIRLNVITVLRLIEEI